MRELSHPLSPRALSDLARLRSLGWPRLRARLRTGLMDALFRAGLCDYFDQRNAGAPRVLTYHGIVADDAPVAGGMDTRETVFRQQVEWLAARYRLVPAYEVGSQPGAIAITFDDGLGSDHARAAPILEAHGARGTFFVCSDLAAGDLPGTWHDVALLGGLRRFLDLGRSWEGALAAAQAAAVDLEERVRAARLEDPYTALEAAFGGEVYGDFRRMAAEVDPVRFGSMGQGQVRDLSERGHEVGSHSRRHRILAHLAAAPEALAEDLAGSRATLADMTGAPVESLAYPYGGHRDVGTAVETAAAAAGYARAYVNAIPKAVTPLRLARLQAPTAESRSELFAVSSGLLHFLRTGRLLPGAGVAAA